MQMIFISGLIGFGIAVVIFILFWIFKLKYSSPGREIRIHASLEELRSVGELVVFKVITKEIVTTSMHWLGEKGKKYFFGKTIKIIEMFKGAKYVYSYKLCLP